MKYLISDIHGNYVDFLRILSKVEFDEENDHLIIMGDILDRGPDGIRLIEYVRPFIEKGCMELLMGNHEIFAIMYLKGELDRGKWSAFGGESTIQKIEKMDEAEKGELLNYLENLSYYAEINSPYFGDTVVTHTGIDADNYIYNYDGTINITQSIKQAVKNNLYNYIVGTDLHNIPVGDKRKFDKYMIVGHTPCYRLNDDMSNIFYRSKYYMDIDAGAGHKSQGGKLGIYCVDTDEEVYL